MLRLVPLLLLAGCATQELRSAPDAVDRRVDAPAPSVAPPALEEADEGDAAGWGAPRHLGAVGGELAPVQQLPALRAGATDDNADYPAFLRFLGAWTDRPGLSGLYQRLDLRDRGHVRVRDADGVPLPGARVSLLADGHAVHAARTYGDGRAPLYPWVSGDAPAGLEVVGRHGGEVVRAPWRPGEALELTVDVAAVPEPAVPVDVAFVLDTTGSMSDELDRLKETLLTTVERLEGLDRPVSLRLGAVLYRDRGDAYVTRSLGLTGDVQRVDDALRQVRAGGGGDTPEALNEGLAAAIHGLAWREDAARVAFLIADAPPHMDYDDDTPYGTTALEAVGRAVRVHTVAASGLDEVGSLVFRQIAAVTRGQFVFIEYGGDVVGSAASHGVDGAEQVASNDLDRILFDRVRAEVDGWRR